LLLQKCPDIHPSNPLPLLTLLSGTFLLSIFHALIPSHWLPILAVGRQEGWAVSRILWVTLLAGTAHVASTVLFGFLLAWVGDALTNNMASFSAWIAPSLLVVWGIVYLYRHYHHKHFHIGLPGGMQGLLIPTLLLAMFFSPCLEIEGYFLSAGQYGWWFVSLLALMYGVVTLMGMMLWMRLALSGLKKVDWHAWEHNAGLITGFTLILSGILMLILE
jgi:hypothetical protein